MVFDQIKESLADLLMQHDELDGFAVFPGVTEDGMVPIGIIYNSWDGVNTGKLRSDCEYELWRKTGCASSMGRPVATREIITEDGYSPVPGWTLKHAQYVFRSPEVADMWEAPLTDATYLAPPQTI